MDINSILQGAGPYTAPLCAMLVYALKWAMGDRDRLIELLKVADEDRFRLREKRADDLERAANEYRDFGESTRTAIVKWTSQIEELSKTKGE